MERLLEQLTASGLVDAVTADWARAYQAEHELTLDDALLELDLIDEEELLRGLGKRFGMEAALPVDLARVDPEVGKRFPLALCKSFFMCPVRLSKGEVVVLVEAPLLDESVQELRGMFGLQVAQRVATSHHLAVARSRVYGVAIDPRTEELEARLATHRAATAELSGVLQRVAAAPRFATASAAVLDYAARLVACCCFVVIRKDELRIAAARSADLPPWSVRLPELGCSFGAALRHGGYFMGPLTGAAQDQDFYLALGRPLPKWVFVAPVSRGESTIMFYADNAGRGIAQRRVAELTLLLARLGQRGIRGNLESHERAAPDIAAEPQTPLEVPTLEPQPQKTEPAITEPEREALARLRAVALAEGVTVEALVDVLLAEHLPERRSDAPAALATEVLGLFEKLASDIPTQLARGMEAAFRDMVPRLAVGAAVPAVPAPPRPSASVELVQVETAPREVASYRSRRRKSRRVKL